MDNKEKQFSKFSNMAIYIDEHAYDENPDWDKIYTYICEIVMMLSQKMRLFKKNEDYKKFSHTVASDVIMRYLDPTQFKIIPGKKQKTKIKSVMNFIKSSLYLRRVQYEQENYAQIIYDLSGSEEDYSNLPIVPRGKVLLKNISDISEGFYQTSVSAYLSDFDFSVRKFLANNTPYKYSSPMWYNIYTSCMLSVIYSINNKKFTVKLFNLSSSYYNLIVVLLNKIKLYLAQDLSYLSTSDNYSEELMVADLNGGTVEDTYYE